MNQTDADRMMQMITGYWVTQVVHAAARFSIADYLAKAPATAGRHRRCGRDRPISDLPRPQNLRIAEVGQIRWQFPIRRNILAGYSA